MKFYAVFACGKRISRKSETQRFTHAWRVVGADTAVSGFATSRATAVLAGMSARAHMHRRSQGDEPGEPEIVRAREEQVAPLEETWRLRTTALRSGRVLHVWTLPGTGLEVQGEPAKAGRCWTACRRWGREVTPLRGASVARRFGTWQAAARAAIDKWVTK